MDSKISVICNTKKSIDNFYKKKLENVDSVISNEL